MVKTLSLALFAWCAIQLAPFLPAQEKADKRDALAREAAEQFAKAMLKGDDIDALMKAVDVPFFFDGKEVMKDRERLKKNLESLLNPTTAPPECKVWAVFPFASVPKGVFAAEDDELLKAVIGKTDRVVLLHLPRRALVIAVRTRDDGAKVIGFQVNRSVLPLLAAAQEKEKSDKNKQPARDTAEKTARAFLKAGAAQDLDALEKLSDVPWYRDGEKVVEGRDELNQHLKSAWVDRVPQGQKLAHEVVFTVSYAVMREFLREPRLAVAEKCFAKDDQVVFVRDVETKRGGFVVVRVRDGKGKVIGAGQ